MFFKVFNVVVIAVHPQELVGFSYSLGQWSGVFTQAKLMTTDIPELQNSTCSNSDSFIIKSWAPVAPFPLESTDVAKLR